MFRMQTFRSFHLSVEIRRVCALHTERENANWKGNSKEMSGVCSMENRICTLVSPYVSIGLHTRCLVCRVVVSFIHYFLPSFLYCHYWNFVYIRYRCCCYGFSLNGQSSFQAGQSYVRFCKTNTPKMQRETVLRAVFIFE